MYEFGEEFIIESYKVPWLIWIQLLITLLLLLLLLVGFSLVASDPSNHPSSAACGSRPSSSGQSNHKIQRIDEKQKFEGLGTTTSRGVLRGEERSFGGRRHPCHYLGLAKQAFLKCLGLDCSCSESDKQGKED
ncbi:PREDICTED: uncharacterized protein LOC109191710 [Ipomoea nil]|uniref:uncharacterized protein LOC109191710 n=1 Tax=Ipomoea nil TaxID=35883 RepID=UPI000901AB46|nr:PREDICTED: uncharacterized protein LOC109191710 [Ipomoea nil]